MRARLVRAAVCAVGILAAIGAGPALAGPEATASCVTRVPSRLLPEWARGGFSDPRPHMPYVLGARGSILAILWADPLLAPPAKTHNNKILWVSRAVISPGSDLVIDAQRVARGAPVGRPVTRRVFGGPGPSIINLPEPGCYRLQLRWSGHADSLSLVYASNR